MPWLMPLDFREFLCKLGLVAGAVAIFEDSRNARHSFAAVPLRRPGCRIHPTVRYCDQLGHLSLTLVAFTLTPFSTSP